MLQYLVAPQPASPSQAASCCTSCQGYTSLLARLSVNTWVSTSAQESSAHQRSRQEACHGYLSILDNARDLGEGVNFLNHCLYFEIG